MVRMFALAGGLTNLQNTGLKRYAEMCGCVNAQSVWFEVEIDPTNDHAVFRAELTDRSIAGTYGYV